MNPGFLNLSEERKKQIINAGFQVFAQNSYKKAPVAEIAAQAGISKSLLFYHFKNKKELYLFLWNTVLDLTRNEMKKENVLGTSDFFEMMSRSLKVKCNLLQLYPYASQFSLRAYYEQDSNISEEIQNNFEKVSAESEEKIFSIIDTSKLREDINLHEMYQEIVWAADGYMHFALLKGKIDADVIAADFEKLISMWKKVYQK